MKPNDSTYDREDLLVVTLHLLGVNRIGFPTGL